jgi:hypothetical protein
MRVRNPPPSGAAATFPSAQGAPGSARKLFADNGEYLTVSDIAQIANAIQMGTAITANGALPSGDLGKLTPITTAGVAVTLPSAASLADGTQAVHWNVSAGSVTVNGTTVQAGGIIVHYVRSNAWVIGNKPYAAAVGGAGGGLVRNGFVANRLITAVGGTRGDANSLLSDNPLAHPILLPAGTYDAAVIRNGNAAASGSVRAGVYTVAAGVPTSLLAQSASFAKSAGAGAEQVIPFTSPLTLAADAVVLAAIASTNYDTVAHFNTSSQTDFASLMGVASSALTQGGSLPGAITVASGFTANPTFTATGDAIPIIWLRKSA